MLFIPIGIPIKEKKNIVQYLAIILSDFINVIIVLASYTALLQMTENLSDTLGR